MANIHEPMDNEFEITLNLKVKLRNASNYYKFNTDEVIEESPDYIKKYLTNLICKSHQQVDLGTDFIVDSISFDVIDGSL